MYFFFITFQSFLGTCDTQMILESNTAMVEQREREIQQVVKSIAELHGIFKDLACMVADQVSSVHFKCF